MNKWQLCRQLKYVLESMVWPGGSNPVFSNCEISAVPAAQLIGRLRHPFAVVHPPSSTNERETTKKQSLTLNIEIFQEHENDEYGRSVVVGGNHDPSTNTSTEGRGLLEIEQLLTDTLHAQALIDGIRYFSITRSGNIQGQTTGKKTRAMKTLTLEVGMFEEETYPDVYKLSGSVSGSDVVLAWTDNPDRFDRLHIVICRKSGSNPTGPTDGFLANVLPGVQTYTDTAPGSGAWNYAAFAAYDKRFVDTPSAATDYAAGNFTSVTVP